MRNPDLRGNSSFPAPSRCRYLIGDEVNAQVATSASYGEILQTIHFLHGPKVFGGRALSAIEDLDVSRLEEAIKLIEVRLNVHSGDLGVAAYVDTSESSSSISGSRP